jgi:hypothetical protein
LQTILIVFLSSFKKRGNIKKIKTIFNGMLLSGLLIVSTALAQVESKFIDGKSFQKLEGKWYSVNSKTNQKFLINESSLTLKLKENFPKQAFENFCKAQGIEIERENMLGFIDLKLPKTSGIFGMHTKFKNSNMFEWIDINSFGSTLSSYPDDEGFSQQFYVDDRSSNPNININSIWDYIVSENINPSDITVAVIDLGVDAEHGDLNLVDGYDFYQDDNDSDPLDDDHHGTRVAGIIGAKTNNGYAVAGVAGGWNNNNSNAVNIMPIRAGRGPKFPGDQEEKQIFTTYVDDAIIFAANNGANIINMSIAVDELNAIKSALNYAYKKKGCLLVAGSGNDRSRPVLFPANQENVIAVAGITYDYLHYGNNGSDLDLVAPAENIYTLVNSTTPSDRYTWGGSKRYFL